MATNLTFSGENVRKILITSCAESEGKTHVAMNLMRTMSDLGYRVVMVDLDLRRSRIAADYGLDFSEEGVQGTAHYLAGMCEIDDILYQTELPGAYVVPCGRTVKNSLQLLNTPREKTLLDTLAEHFDYVLVDTPPVGVIIDAAQIAQNCDGALLVVSYNKVSRKTFREVCDQLSGAGIPILGSVINKVDISSISGKHYYSKGYYSRYDRYDAESIKPKKKKWL